MTDGFTLEEYVVDRPFFQDEEPVLSCSLRLPKLTGNGAAVRRINRYYKRLMDQLVRGWERHLYPNACLDALEARKASYPFRPYEAKVTFQLTLRQDELLSLYWDSYLYTGETHGLLQRHGDTWSLTDGHPMPMSAFFPPKTKLRKTLPPIAVQQAQAGIAAGTSLYYDDVQRLLFRCFDQENFYLTENHLAFFYPLYSIAPYVEGIPTFTVPMTFDGLEEKNGESFPF